MTNALRLRRERYSAGSSRERVGDRRLLRPDPAAAARATGRQNRLSRRCSFVLRSIGLRRPETRVGSTTMRVLSRALGELRRVASAWFGRHRAVPVSVPGFRRALGVLLARLRVLSDDRRRRPALLARYEARGGEPKLRIVVVTSRRALVGDVRQRANAPTRAREPSAVGGLRTPAHAPIDAPTRSR